MSLRSIESFAEYIKPFTIITYNAQPFQIMICEANTQLTLNKIDSTISLHTHVPVILQFLVIFPKPQTYS